MEPFERYRRGLAKFLSRRKPFPHRRYLEEEGRGFDSRLLDVKVQGAIYLDGLWQSENYFKDMEKTIRHDLRVIPPQDSANVSMARKINLCNAVAVHIRWFEDSVKNGEGINMPAAYYSLAIEKIMDKVQCPHFFIFSDKPDAACQMLGLPHNLTTVVSHNNRNMNDYADLWLMKQCKHFIIANSTFSWWGAWLAESPCAIIIAPGDGYASNASAWLCDLIPEQWLRL
jgi:hypothetical protein